MNKETNWVAIVIIIWILIMILFGMFGCTCLGLPTKPPTPIIPTPTPIDQLWNAAKGVNWLATVSILGIAIGVFGLMNGSKFGVPAAVASCVSLFMTLAVARFALWMAVCGLIGSVLVCAASILLKNRAIKEFIIGIQRVKESNGNKEEINKLVTEGIQAKSTRKLVQSVKADLKVKGEI